MFLFCFLFCCCCYGWFWLLISEIICVCIGGWSAHICRYAYLYAHEGYSMTKYFHLWLYTHRLNAGSLNRKLPILVRLARQWAFRFCLSQSLNAMIMGIYAAMPKLFFFNTCLELEGRSFCLSSNHAYHLNPPGQILRSWVIPSIMYSLLYMFIENCSS